MVAVPYTFASGGTIDYAQVNANFDALEGAFSNLSNSNLASGAGITADKLADRFIVYQDTFNLVPLTPGTDLGTLTEFTTPASDTTLMRHRFTFPAGREAYLCEVEFYVHDITVGGADVPTIAIQVNGTTVGGATFSILGDEAYWRARNSDPTAAPLLALSNGDVISFVFGRTAGGGAPTIAGVWCRLVYKVRLTS